MRPFRLVLALIIGVTVFGACRGGKKVVGKGAPTAEGYRPPPVAYVVGKTDVDKEAAEPSMRMSVAVDPATPTKDIERLLNYFDKERYAGFDIVWVDVYFDVAKAQSPDTNVDALVATLRVNRPGFRELKISDEMTESGPPEGGQPEVTSETEETVYLGARGRMFDSARQAQTLVDLMEEKPGHSVYRVLWQAPEECELTYSVNQKMLVRVRRGVARETWGDMTLEELKRAARGSGFGGPRRHGGGYSYNPATTAEAETAKK